MTNIGERIKLKRLECGYSQDELAKKMGYKSRSTINKIELGINDITQSKVSEFAQILETSVAYLMGWSEAGAIQKEKALTPEGERGIGDDDIKFALFGTREIDDDVLDRVKQFAKFAQENEKNK